MKVTTRGLLRTTLYSSTAGVLLGVPLLTCVPQHLRGQEQMQPGTVIRAQSAENTGAFSRLFGNRTSGPTNVASDLSDQTVPQPTSAGPGMIGRVFGAPAPAAGQPTRSQMRAQAKFMRKNPYAARIMMLQQQQQLLQQQQEALQGEYEEEGIPEPEVFDSLKIDASEWADAPGRQITEELPPEPQGQAWWQTGEKPANSRERRRIEDEPAASAATSTPGTAPAAATPAPAVSASAAAEPNPAPAVEEGTAVRTTTPGVSSTTPAPAATQGGVEEWSLTFPESAPAATPQAAAATPTVEAPATVASPAAPAAATPALSEAPFVPPEPAGTATVQLPTVPADSPPLGEPDFIPPEPDAPLGTLPPATGLDRPATGPASPTAPFYEAPAPASPAVPLDPRVAPQITTSQPSEPAAAPAATDADPFPAAPAEVAELPTTPAESPAVAPADSPFTGLRLDGTPTAPLQEHLATPGTAGGEPSLAPGVEEFLPPKPVQNAPAYSADVPLMESAPPVATEVVELPPEPASIPGEQGGTVATPGASPLPTEEPTLPTSPAARSSLPRFAPADLGFDEPSSGDLAPQNPAEFIPPEPEDFGSQFQMRSQDYYVPGVPSGPPAPVAPVPDVPSAPAAERAPDITLWSPDPLPQAAESLQIPDPIVAPSTAKRLEAAPPPTPRQTNAKLERIASRQGLNGFKGFCPVALKDHRELLDARPEFSAVYNGRRYFFSSAASQAMFESNPAEYAPAALGNDVVHLMLTGESRPGSLEHAVWFRSRLYMFATAETMETFVASPSIHAWEE